METGAGWWGTVGAGRMQTQTGLAFMWSFCLLQVRRTARAKASLAAEKAPGVLSGKSAGSGSHVFTS